MSNIIYIDILDHCLNSELWSLIYPHKHYTGHTHYRSAYESDDNCGTCDGARCDSCRTVTDPAGLEFSVPVNILEDILSNYDIPEEVKRELIYNDRGINTYKGYHLVWPNDTMLKERHKTKYDTFLQEKLKAKNLKFEDYEAMCKRA